MYFVIFYGKVIAPDGQGTGSNEKLSKLYQTLGGIPLLHCPKTNRNSLTVCEPTNSADESFDIHVANPVYQRFPRVYTEDSNKPQVHTECLSRGHFVEYLTNSDKWLRATKITDKILAEFTREYLLEQSGIRIIDYRTYVILLHILRYKMRDQRNITEAMDLCKKFMLCLRNYPDGELFLIPH